MKPYLLLSPLAKKLLIFFPDLEAELKQAYMKERPIEFLSKCLFTSLLISILLSISLIKLNLWWIGIILFPFAFYSFASIPKRRIKRRIREIELNLYPALCSLYIRLRAGMPFYHALKGIAKGYGALSDELKRTIKEIEGGKDVSLALEDLALRNPSIPFRRIVWQMNSAIISGVDVSKVLESTIKSLAEERRIMLRKYGAELSPLSLIYLLLAIIFPSLGTVAILLISGFLGLIIPSFFIYLIPVYLSLVGFFIVSIAKTRRPFI